MSIEAMKQSLEALQHAVPKDTKQAREQFDAIQALRTAIQQARTAESEPVARCLTEAEQAQTALRDPVIWLRDIPRGQNLYTHPAPGVPDALNLLKSLGPKPWETSPEAHVQARLISDFADALTAAQAQKGQP